MALNYQQTTTCPHCHQETRPGELICQHCQRPMSPQIETRTRGLEYDLMTAELASPTGSAYLSPDEPLVLQIEGVPDSLWLEPRRQVVLGRVHPQNPKRPDLDLGPFRGFDLGVSTRHAALVRHLNNELIIEDLTSRNGTFLNGERLRPHVPYPVHSGDHLRLGNLCLQINFGG